MGKILQGKEIFLDTSVFADASFNLSSPAFRRFAELCHQRRLVLLTTRITRAEIEATIRRFTDEARCALSEVSKAICALQETQVPVLRDLAEKLNLATFVDTVSKAHDEFFAKCHVVEMAIPPTAVSRVLDLYFDAQPPFGAGKKKSEFPDAFTLQAILARARTRTVHVISSDKDFKTACVDQPNVVYMQSLGRLLDLINAHNATVERVLATVQSNFKSIEEQLIDLLQSLPPELESPNGTAHVVSVRLDDVLDTLVVSCERAIAAVEFVCHATINAIVELGSPADDCPDTRHVEQTEFIHITLVFRFDPKNPSIFQVQQVWCPATLRIHL